MPDTTPDIPDKLWSTANLITGFAAAQTMAYLIAIGNPAFSKSVGQTKVAWIVFVCTFIACALYNIAVWWCHRIFIGWYKTIKIDPILMTNIERVSFQMTVGRSIALVFFWLLAAFPAFLL